MVETGVKRIFLLDYGWVAGEMGWFIPDPGIWGERTKPKITEWVEIPVSGAVIEHEDGLILLDTGELPRAERTGDSTWEIFEEVFPLTRFTDENRLENQLKLIGLAPEDIDYVVFTHLHPDHAGQAYIFKDLPTPLVVHKKELMWAAYMMYLGKSGDYQPVDLEPLRGGQWFPIDSESFELLPGVELILMGAHTPGSIVVKVTTKSGNNYIFTGDFIHLPEELEKESKGWLLRDLEEYLTGLRKIKLMMKRPKTHLVISHDPNLWEKYPKAPKALE